jgi:ABC-2 type transport system ATP-binding protein
VTAPAIALHDIGKSFGDQIVLDGVDLEVPRGAIFALLGPNGAGKTTLVHILSTLLRADRGEARVDGHDVVTDPGAVRAAIGVTGQFSAVDELLTGRENLALMADLFHLDRAVGAQRLTDLLIQFDLVDAADRSAATYSGGMRRRLDLAMTLMGTPSIVFLDEPTTGLDPNSRRTMWDIITELARRGTTILLTTQYLEEADRLADRVAVLDHGRIVAEGTPAELKARVPGGWIRLGFASLDDFTAARGCLTAASPGVGAEPEIEPDVERLRIGVPSDGSVAALRGLLDRFDRAGVRVERVAIETPDLNDVFFALTGHRPDPEDASPSVAPPEDPACAMEPVR